LAVQERLIEGGRYDATACDRALHKREVAPERLSDGGRQADAAEFAPSP
jgi:hypothetical protein